MKNKHGTGNGAVFVLAGVREYLPFSDKHTITVPPGSRFVMAYLSGGGWQKNSISRY
jgi:hypothetical protein